MSKIYAQLSDALNGQLLLQTHLKSYLDSVELIVDENGIELDASTLSTLLGDLHATDAQAALMDLVALVKYAGIDLKMAGLDGHGLLGQWTQALPEEPALYDELQRMGVLLAPSTSGTADADIYLGDAAANSFNLETVVGRARAGCHRVGWQGVRTPQATACKDEQRRQRARGRPDRVRSAFTQAVKAIEVPKVSVRATFLKVTSGQLRFLGLKAAAAMTL